MQPRHKRVKHTDFECTVCAVWCSSDADLQQHVSSRCHKQHVQHGERPPAAPANVLPFTRPASVTATEQLTSILLLQWHGFVLETLAAMFLLRGRQVAGFLRTGQLGRAATQEEFANLALQQPTYIRLAAHHARERLACENLTRGAAVPTVRVLSNAAPNFNSTACIGAFAGPRSQRTTV